MVENESSRGDEILEMALVHLQRQPIPEFTNPIVVFSAESDSRHPKSRFAVKRTIRASINPFHHRWVIAAGIAIAILCGTFSIFPGTSSNLVAFGQVQEAIRGLRSLKFEQKTFVGDQVTGRFKITYSQAGNIRLESGLESHILNATQKEYMSVNDSKRTAIIQPVYDKDAIKERIFGSLDVLFQIQPLQTTHIRSLVMNGRPVRELSTVWDGSVAKVLVDAKTNLPISIGLDRGKNQDGIAIREELSQFEFDFDIQPSLFAIDPPKNYEITRIERNEPPKSSEQLTLTLGEGIGPVRFGMSLQEVRNLFGDPSTFESLPGTEIDVDENGDPKLPMKLVPANPPYVIGVMHYRGLGLRIDVSSTNGVEWIRCYETSLTSKGFEGKTANGIQIGMPKSDVMKIIDENDLFSRNGKPMLSDDHWVLNGIDIGFRDDKCSVIAIGIQNYFPQKE
jgi:outer membrane lipoprotein-sorting protein